MRFTPITLPFQRTALLSHRIASRLGYTAEHDATEAEGLLIDVAELWELFVLNCARLAAGAGDRVEHGTTAGRSDYLLRSEHGIHGMGKLKPDILVLRGEDPVAVLDAKYKRLANTLERPTGVDRGDLYQLAAYAARFRPSCLSALLYPAFDGALSTAERSGPWLAAEQRLAFVRLPTTVTECTSALAELFKGEVTSPIGV